MKKLIYGIGINDADYNVRPCVTKNGKKTYSMCPIYRRWFNMITRCYSKNYHARRPTYIGCSVSEQWKKFSCFSKWMVDQDWDFKHLDKDILIQGNKIYSAKNCVFVGQATNAFMLDRGGKRGKYLIGVSSQQVGRFRSHCNNSFTKKTEWLGDFKSELEAHMAWKCRKHSLALQLAGLQDDPRVANALRIRYAPNVEDKS